MTEDEVRAIVRDELAKYDQERAEWLAAALASTDEEVAPCPE